MVQISWECHQCVELVHCEGDRWRGLWESLKKEGASIISKSDQEKEVIV